MCDNGPEKLKLAGELRKINYIVLYRVIYVVLDREALDTDSLEPEQTLSHFDFYGMV